MILLACRSVLYSLILALRPRAKYDKSRIGLSRLSLLRVRITAYLNVPFGLRISSLYDAVIGDILLHVNEQSC